MRVYGKEVTQEQIAAGLAAMTGEFTVSDVEDALERAGCEYEMRAADRLLQKERKAGRIKFGPDGKWRTLPTGSPQ